MPVLQPRQCLLGTHSLQTLILGFSFSKVVMATTRTVRDLWPTRMLLFFGSVDTDVPKLNTSRTSRLETLLHLFLRPLECVSSVTNIPIIQSGFEDESLIESRVTGAAEKRLHIWAFQRNHSLKHRRHLHIHVDTCTYFVSHEQARKSQYVKVGIEANCWLWATNAVPCCIFVAV